MLQAALLVLVLAAPSGETPTVTVEFATEPLAQVAVELSKLTGLSIRASEEVQTRRVTLALEDAPLSEVLRLLEDRASVQARLQGKGWVLESSGMERPISLDLRNAPLEDIFRLFHEISGLSFAVHPDVAGKVITIDLDSTPWDQALDLIARTHDLDVVWEGKTLLIGPRGIVPSKLTLEEGQVGLECLLYVGERNGAPGVHAAEILAVEGLTVLDAQWARNVERQAGQFQEAFGLSEVNLVSAPRIINTPGEWAEVETTVEEEGDTFSIRATAWPGQGKRPKQVRVQVTLWAWGREIGTTDVLATVGKPFTLAGRDSPTGSYLFLSVTPWVGPVGQGRFDLPRPEDLDEIPQRVHYVEPTYPAELRKAGVQGKVVFDATVEKTGEVSELDVLYAGDEALVEAAATAVRQWRYATGRRDGSPTRFKIVVRVQFKLE